MSVVVNLAPPAAARVDAPVKHLRSWAPLLILVAIAASAIVAGIYADAPILDASIVGP